ncbi:MAG: PKD domain-containing protein [Methanospirillum sp.]|uniref:PKD domain-containing protein n=1 Tax=Methanospirillum sp. TaxID=45200 RepID=UPI00236DD71C|nr:PKD domain-containing protein [Methanospirillum sp.]MDD1729366.1 PKD domain-containing protein [Methanospirillum sp.]
MMTRSDLSRPGGFFARSAIIYLLLLCFVVTVTTVGYGVADDGVASDTITGNRVYGDANDSYQDSRVPGSIEPVERLKEEYPFFRDDTGLNTITGNASSLVPVGEPEGESTGSGGNDADIQLTGQKCFGGTQNDWPVSVINTTDGGFLVGGQAESDDGDVSGRHGIWMDDIWVVKLDAARNLEWQKCLGGTDEDSIDSVIQTTDGGYLVGGQTYSEDGDVSGYQGGSDIWVVKLDAAGNITWQKCLGGSRSESPCSIVQTTDGGYLVGGQTYSIDGNVTGNHGNSDLWAVKLDTTGNITWQTCLGGLRNEEAYSLLQTSDGGYLFNGNTYSTDSNVTGNHGETDIWVVKLDSVGNMTWQTCLGGSDYDISDSVIQTTDGGYLVNGYTYSTDGNVTGNHGETDIWAVKLDSAGNMTWQTCLGGLAGEWPYSLIQTTDGGYLVNGYTESDDANVTGNHGGRDIWVVNLDASGTLVWQKCLGGTNDDYPRSILQTTDGGFLLRAMTYSDDGDVSGLHGQMDYWVVKLDAARNLVWQRCLGGSSYEWPEFMVQTPDGNYVVCGSTDSDDGDVVGNHGSYDVWMVLLTAEYPVTATADSWTISYPSGTTSYIEKSNATYLAQAKPGADLVNVSVDHVLVGPVSNWTFSTITSNHTFATTGQPTPGQVHAFFTMNTTWGAVPLTVQFTNQSLGNPTVFVWDFGDGGSSTEQDPVHTYTVPGRYPVTLRATNDWTGGIATQTNAVTATDGVVPSPTPTPVPGEITAAFSADQTSGAAPMQVSFLDQSTGSPTSWLWSLGDGTIAASQNVTHIYAAKGTYSVTLTAQNSVSSGSIEKNGFITVT